MKNKYNKVYHYVFIHQKVVREIIKKGYKYFGNVPHVDPHLVPHPASIYSKQRTQ